MNLIEAFHLLRETCADHQRKGFFGKRKTLPDQDLQKEAWECLASAAPETVIPRLANFILISNEKTRRKLHPLFMDMALRLPVSLWPKTDERIRSNYYNYYGDSPPDLAFVEGQPASESILITGLCHFSGHLREKAVRNVEKLPSLLASALLLVRINDWVLPVRIAAAEKLVELLERLTPQEKLSLVPVLLRLRECARHRLHDHLDAWLKILATPFDESSWLTAWQTARGGDRKSYLNLLKSSGHLPSQNALEQLLRSNDRLVLFWLIREVVPKLELHKREEVLLSIRKSRVVAVKREWLSHCLENRPHREMENILTEALLDPSRGLRQFARFHLGRISNIHLSNFYQESLSHPATEAIALEALAEVSPEVAHREALTRLNSKLPVILKAALGSLSSASLDQHLDFLIQTVGSEMPGVSKVARKRLFEIRRMVGAELIAQPELWNNLPVTTQFHLVRMVPQFQKWDSLEFLLARLGEGSFIDEVGAALMTWCRNADRVFSKLGSTRKAKLLTYLESAGLAAELAENLRFCIARAD